MSEPRTITINNGNFNNAPVSQDTLPKGDGVATQNTTIDIIIEMKLEIDLYLEEKYNCFKTLLGKESERTEDYTNSEVTSGTNPNIPLFGFPFGPGRIKDNKDGKKRGYIGKSNIFVGVPDKRAEDLSKKLETIISQEEVKRINTLNENCEDED